MSGVPELVLQHFRICSGTSYAVLLLSFLASALFATSWRTAFIFQADEGYNLVKALLVLKGHRLYGLLWSDQPPLISYLFAWLFGIVGPSAAAARLVVLTLSVALVGGLYALLVSRQSGTIAAVTAVIVVGSSASYLQLSVSALVGLPAYALATLSVACLVCGAESKGTICIPLSGFLLALAAQTKMSALLAAPAVLVWLAFLPKTCTECSLPRLRALLFWTASLLLTFVAIALLTGFDLKMVAGTHWGQATRDAFASPSSSSSLLWKLLADDIPIVVLALVALVLGVARKRWEILLPATWTLTALAVQAWHRPFWYHHYLHVIVPMTWLGCIGLQYLVDAFGQVNRESLRLSPFKSWGVILALSLACSGLLAMMPGRIERMMSSLPSGSFESEWRCVAEMKKLKAETKWVFADDVIFAFHAGMLVPPEIAVLSYKRLKAGLITQPELLQLLIRYNAEQVLVNRHVFDAAFMAYVREHYSPVFQEGSIELFVRNDLVGKRANTPVANQNEAK